MKGAHALAVRGNRALLLGEYGDASTGHVLELGAEREARRLEEVRLRAPAGRSLEKFSARAVGSTVYFVDDDKVMVLDDW